MINNIVPTPKRVELYEETVSIPFAVEYDRDEWKAHAERLSAAFEKLWDKPLEKAAGGIRLVCDHTLVPGSYVLDSHNGVVLSAPDSEGILYAMATLIQAVTVKDGRIIIEKALISDYPEKDYRALMIDLAREWHPAHTVHKYIDLCFILKIKYLHLHFIDDQLYTLPSKAFPLLNKEGRFYSYEELSDMRSHARETGIVIVPEFETPGHSEILNKKYPEVFANTLEGDGGRIVTEEGRVITGRNVVCAGKPETFEGVKTLLNEMIELFPESPYVHIGGDEANIKAWTYCTHCKAYMKEHGISDEYELYSEFVGKVARYVLDMGRTPIVWEGFPKKGVGRIPKETVVIAWESHYNMAYDLLEDGFRIINGSWQPLYIVPSYTKRWGIPEIMNWNVYNWQHWWPHSEARLNPINVSPTDRVLGAQLSVWECTFEQEVGRTVENLVALSERTWTVRRLWDDGEFSKRAKPTIQLAAKFIQDV